MAQDKWIFWVLFYFFKFFTEFFLLSFNMYGLEIVDDEEDKRWWIFDDDLILCIFIHFKYDCK